MKLAVITLNTHSIKEAKKILSFYDVDIFTTEKFLEDGLILLKGGLKNSIKMLFEEYDCIIFIMAIGIIVRLITPYLKHKSMDPAVLSMSADGKYIIPVLSGHLGGANSLALDLSSKLNIKPVITTTSDVLNKKAVDIIAQENNLVITSFKDAMDLTSLDINNEPIIIYSDVKLKDSSYINNLDDIDCNKISGLIYISYKKDFKLQIPTAWLIPKNLVLGIGVRRGISYERISTSLNNILEDYNIDIRGIGHISSIDLKKDEEGIITLSNKLNIPFETYSAKELSVVSDRFQNSEFVKKTTGVGAVCMPAGYLGSNMGRCIVEKIAKDGITISIWENLSDIYN